MEKLKDKVDKYSLDDLYNCLADEIGQLATAEYRLKMVFVLLFIIEECRKALNKIDTNSFLDNLKVRIGKVAEQSEIEKDQLIQTFIQDVRVVETLDCKDDSVIKKVADIRRKIAELEDVLGKLIKQRDQLTLTELKKE